MFSDLYDYISILFFWRWPTAEGVVTAVDVLRTSQLCLVVRYEFSVTGDGPYAGESSWPALSGETRLMDISKKLPIGKAVTVRYRPDNPSVNRLDRSVWQEFEGL